MARWITVRSTFDYHWPGRSAVTKFGVNELGEQFVKDEIADFAVDKGYATEGKLDASARSKKGTGAKRKNRSKKDSAPAKTADTGTVETVDHEDAADADRAAGGASLDSDAG